MRTFATSVTDLHQEFAGDFDTFPYECGWADEAIFFVDLHDPRPGDVLVLRTQVSADGIRWLDEGTALSLTGPGAGFVRLTRFGGFLRLAGSTTTCTLTIRLVLKG